MNPFNNFTDLIKYYNNKQKIPSTISLFINGKEQTFTKWSSNSIDLIQKRQIDTYHFHTYDMNGLNVEFTVTYYRYFELKVILEAFFTYCPDEETDNYFLSPVYFYEKFIKEKDFEHWKSGLSNSLEKSTGLKWVDTSFCKDAFIEMRKEAYENVQRNLFYQLMLFLDTEYFEDDAGIDYYKNEARKKKWRINEKGESPYFIKQLEVPDFW